MDITSTNDVKQFISTETNIAALKQLYAVCYNSNMEDNAILVWERVRELKDNTTIK